MLYTVSQRYVFREYHQVFNPGDTVELTPEQADFYMHFEPGLLKEARQTTQGHPGIIREIESALGFTHRTL